MARPRKNRISEYAGLLAEELHLQISTDLQKGFAESQKVFEEEIARLRSEIKALTRRVEALSQRNRPSRSKIGKWVPGGPGRPPKDAEERMEAFASRKKPRTKRKRKRKKPER